MTLNIYFDARPIHHILHDTVYVQSTTQQKNYKNGSETKFTFEVISSNYFIKFTVFSSGNDS